jgi:2-phospho-L-lactate guanylyltransferase
MIAALVPVGALAGAKSRLRSALPAGAVERLCLAMLGDVLAALARVPALERVAVVTPDPAVAAAARAAGAEALLRPDPLNAAVDAAAAELAPGPDAALLGVLRPPRAASPWLLRRMAAPRPCCGAPRT